MNRDDLARYAAEMAGLRPRPALHVVRIMFEEIAKALLAGEQVRIENFGVFRIRTSTRSWVPSLRIYRIAKPSRSVRFVRSKALRAWELEHL